MAIVKIISWNFNGLHSPIKRMKVLHHLKYLRADTALLQESHLPETAFHHLKKLWVGEVVGSSVLSQGGYPHIAPQELAMYCPVSCQR